MTSYNVKTGTIGDVTVLLSKEKSKDASERLQALLEALGTDIENGLPESGAHPDQGLPGGGASTKPTPPPAGGTKPSTPSGRPDQSLPLEQLATFLKEEAKEIAAEVLKGTLCDPAQPK